MSTVVGSCGSCGQVAQIVIVDGNGDAFPTNGGVVTIPTGTTPPVLLVPSGTSPFTATPDGSDATGHTVGLEWAGVQGEGEHANKLYGKDGTTVLFEAPAVPALNLNGSAVSGAASVGGIRVTANGYQPTIAIDYGPDGLRPGLENSPVNSLTPVVRNDVASLPDPAGYALGAIVSTDETPSQHFVRATTAGGAPEWRAI